MLGAAVLEHGVNSRALQAYDTLLCAEMSQLVLRNRGAGPFGLLNLPDDRCGGVFDNIDDFIPRAERDEFMLRYKTAAGFAAEKLNAAASTIPRGAGVRQQLSQGLVPVLQHYILIKFKKDTSDEHVGEFCRRMLALRTTISGIEHLEIGRHSARCPQLGPHRHHALCFHRGPAQLPATPGASEIDGV